MPPYNPVNDFYFRQQYQQQFNFPPHQMNIPPINSKFVTNIEEARASMIDGISYNIFLDSSSGKIYLKKLGNNGTSDFIVYSIEENKLTDPIAEINERLTNIENALKGVKNDKSISNDEQPASISQSTVAVSNESDATTESNGFSKNAGNGWRKK